MEQIVAVLTFVTTKLAKKEARTKETQRNKVHSLKIEFKEHILCYFRLSTFAKWFLTVLNSPRQ